MQVTTQTVVDGARNLVVHLTGLDTDGGGDESAVRKVDVSSLTPPCDSVKIHTIDYAVSGGSVQLLWDADVPVQFALLSGQGTLDFRKFGGLVNDGGASASGDILLSTIGFDLNANYDIKLEMTKKF